MRNRHKKNEFNGIPLAHFDGLIPKAEQHKVRVTPVAWGIPYDEVCYSKFMIHFERNAYKMPWDDFIPSEGTYLQQARNYIHNMYLNASTLPFLMMLDSDILFPPRIVETLLQHRKPIIGGWYKDKKAANHHPVVYDFKEDIDGMAVWNHREKPGKGVEQVDATGAGCWLMSREVAEALGKDPYGNNISGGGEDMILCRKLLELKIPLFVDWSINCAHMGVGYY